MCCRGATEKFVDFCHKSAGILPRIGSIAKHGIGVYFMDLVLSLEFYICNSV